MKKVIVVGAIISVAIILLVITLHASSEDENRVVVGAQNFTEQYIVGEILAQLIEDKTDLQVERKFGYSIEDIHQPFLKGEIDLYPEYTGTAWGGILNKNLIYQPDVLYQELKKEYAQEFNATWLDRYGFDNTYGLAMRSEDAMKSGIYSYSDLALKSRPFVLGAERSFYILPDAYPGLEETYNFRFKDKKVLPIDKKYTAIEMGEVDVIDVFSTDGQLEEKDLFLLDDDQNYFPPYEAATVIRNETLEFHPELRDILNSLKDTITDEEMARLNYLVDVGGQEPAEVARLFLVSKGLIDE